MRDPRLDELLEEHGRIASRLGLALAWTDGLVGEKAKACSRTGAAAWKRAQPLSSDPEAAAAFFKRRARARNPAVVASRSGLVLVENDGGEELLDRFGISLPPTVAVRSFRGVHRYYRPPEGREPLKVQIAEDGITTSSDGYLVGAAAVHPTGHVYDYVNGVEEIAVLPREMYDRLVELGNESREQAARSFETGEPIPTGHRNDTIFSLALDLVRAGKRHAEILERLLQVNREQCQPPLGEDLVRKQLEGARTWARSHPTEQEELREKARRLLDDDGAETTEQQPPRKRKAARELVRRPLSGIPIERVELLDGTPLPVGTLSLASRDRRSRQERLGARVREAGDRPRRRGARHLVRGRGRRR